MLNHLIEKFKEDKVAGYVAVISGAFIVALIIVLILVRNNGTTALLPMFDDGRVDSTAQGTSSGGGSASDPRSPLGNDGGVSVGSEEGSGAQDQSPDSSFGTSGRSGGVSRQGAGTSVGDGSLGSRPGFGTVDESRLAQGRGGAYSDEPLLDPNAVVLPPPSISYDGFVLKAPFPPVPASFPVYTLGTNYDKDDALKLAARLGLSVTKVNDQVQLVTVSDDNDSDSNGVLVMDKRNGTYVFLSGGVHTFGDVSTEPFISATNYLVQIHDDHKDIECTATYKRRSTPDVTYVECHRTWETFPILNALSTLNLDITHRLDDLRLGQTEGSALSDPDVFATSDNSDGSERPNAFNTLTIAIDSDGSIVNATSSIRPVTDSVQLASEDIKLPEQALREVRSGNSVFSLATPQGIGTVDVNDLTPNGEGVGEEAIIRDFVIAYLENMPNTRQGFLQPYYLFRGTSHLSGYSVDFIEVVPALKEPRPGNAVLTAARNDVLAVTDRAPVDVINKDRRDTLQYGSFSFEVAPTLPPEQTTTPSCPQYTNCYGAFSDGCYVCYRPRTLIQARAAGEVGRSWDSVCPEGVTQPARFELSNRRTQALRACQPGSKANAKCPVDPSTTLTSTGTCTHIVTASPRVYITDERAKPSDVFISSGATLTYAEPAPTYEDHGWTLKASKDGKLTFADGTKRDDVYYEYNGATIVPQIRALTDRSKGYVVSAENTSEFIISLSRAMNLNSTQAHDFATEVMREVKQMRTPYVRLSLISEDVLNTFLPLHITPKPSNLYRIFLLVEGSDGPKKLAAPVLPLIQWKGLTVVETGVVTP